jgi:phosphoserine phosphatase
LAFIILLPPRCTTDTLLRVMSSRANVSDVVSISQDQMRMVLDVSRLLAVPTDIDELLCSIAKAATVLLGCERASIYLHDSRTDELWTKVALQSSEIRFPCTKGIAGHCFSNAQVVCVEDPYRDPRFNPEPDRKSGFVTRNLLTAPMFDVDGRTLGAVQAVNKTRGAFDQADHALVQLLAEQAGVAVQRHNLQAQAMEIVGLRREMELARMTQQALIPPHPPRLPWVDAAGWNCPASVTGGDCWDMWKMPDGRLGIFLADASGHGIGPALVVSLARTLARAISSSDPDPHRLLARINTRLTEDLEWGRFVTAFLGFLSPDGWLHWSSAGHGPALVRREAGGALEELEPPVQPLGVVREWTEDAPPPVRLEPGGSLIVVSDGIYEASNSAGELFGTPRFMRNLEDLRAEPPNTIVEGLRKVVDTWQGSGEPLDDQTIVAVQTVAANRN